MVLNVYLEQLKYDTRLMDQANKEDKADPLQLQKLFVESDVYYDWQVFISAP